MIWADIYEKWLNFKIKDSELPDIDEQEMFANIMEAVKEYEEVIDAYTDGGTSITAPQLMYLIRSDEDCD